MRVKKLLTKSLAVILAAMMCIPTSTLSVRAEEVINSADEEIIEEEIIFDEEVVEEEIISDDEIVDSESEDSQLFKPYEDATYSLRYSIIDGTDNISITGYVGEDSGELVIPENVGRYTVTEIGSTAFYNSGFTGELHLPSTIEAIGSSAFTYSEGLTGDLYLCEGFKYMGSGALAGCYGFNGTLTVPSTLIDWEYTELVRLNFSTIVNNSNIEVEDYGPGITNLYNNVYEGLSYEPYYGNNEYVTITGYHGPSVDKLVIPSEIDGKTVVAIGESAFDFKRNIGEVILPETLLEIGSLAFVRTAIETVTIPSSVKVIGSNAFYACSNLKTVVIEEGVSEIGEKAFAYDKVLKSISFPESITTMGEGIIDDCTSLKYVENKSSNSVLIPSSNDDCFQWVDSITKTPLEYVDEEKTAVEISEGIAVYVLISDSDWLYADKEDGTIAIKSYVGEQANVVVPSEIDGKTVTEIAGGYVFAKSETIETVSIPDSVEIIGSFAFSECNNLKSVELGNSVKRLSDYAFYLCGKLENVNLPEGLVEIGNRVFGGDVSLKNITLPSTLNKIGRSVFQGTALSEITIPESVTEIGGSVFYSCINLKKVVNLSKCIVEVPDVNSTKSWISEDASLLEIGTDDFYTSVAYAKTGTSYLRTDIEKAVGKLKWQKDGNIVVTFNNWVCDADDFESIKVYLYKNGKTVSDSSTFYAEQIPEVNYELYVDEEYYFSEDADYQAVVTMNYKAADGITNSGNAKVISETWKYSVPDKKLDIPSNIRIEETERGRELRWDQVEHARIYELYLKYYSTSRKAIKRSIVWTTSGQDTSVLINDYGDVTYLSAIIHALSDDIGEYTKSDWSEEYEIGQLVQEKDDYTYVLNLDNSITLTKYNGPENSKLIIPDNLDGYKITALGDNLFYQRADLTGDIVIPTTVVKIGNAVFKGCTGLTCTKLDIPSSVKTIGGEAFYDCGDIKEIILPNSIENIGDNLVFKHSCAGVDGAEYSDWYEAKYCCHKGSYAEAYLKENGCKGLYVYEDHVLEISGLNSEGYTYTGSAIKPVVTVTKGSTVLIAGTDYTVTYSNNINAGTAEVKITGKGNYSFTKTANFTINKLSIESENFATDELFSVKATGNALKPIPPLYYKGGVIAKSNYKVSYYALNEEGEIDSPELEAVVKEGDYRTVLEGVGNYCGTRETLVKVTEGLKLITSVTVSAIANQEYTGEEIKPVLTVKAGKKTLVAEQDYVVDYEDNINVGKAVAIITGIGNYTGCKRVSFKIVGTAITKAKVKGIASSYVYTGDEIEFTDDLSVYIPATKNSERKNLVLGTDYEVSYVSGKNTNAGKATVNIIGINGYTGTLSKTFTIVPYKLTENDSRIVAELVEDEVVYSKGGAKPKANVTFETNAGEIVELTEGKDYTISYRYNTKINPIDSAKPATATITLKKNFSGKISGLKFAVTGKELSEVTMTADDKKASKKKNTYSTKVVLKDTDGKALKIGTDYEKTLLYTYRDDTTVKRGGEEIEVEAGTKVNSKDIIPADTAIVVTAKAKTGSNYTGEISTEYRIVSAMIGSATVEVEKQIFTGSEIEPDSQVVTVKIGSKTLYDNVDYEIVEGSYKNNINKGTASFTIKGIGTYGGTKKVTFKIVATSEI